jgi:cytochrome c oxidase assembly protein subunit 15
MSALGLYRRLLVAAIILAFGVISLGAYVRLSDAGLGCPDWPGCYGHWLGVPDEAHEKAAASEAFPGRPVETPKAWKEMVHRYFAGTLGLLILGIAALSWQPALRRRQSPLLPGLLLLVVAFQGALGMWTVTLLLKPVIVTLHLLGGMATLAILVTLALREALPVARGSAPALRVLAAAALAAVVVQIALGGWVSSNYAALACPDFPLCQGRWLPAADFAPAFALARELGRNADGSYLPLTALTAIHLAHRLGALVVLFLAGTLALALWRTREPAWRVGGLVLATALAMQIGLGIANVVFSLPLPLAVGHNLGAALLLTVCLAINLRLWPAGLTADTIERQRPLMAPDAAQGNPSAP